MTRRFVDPGHEEVLRHIRGGDEARIRAGRPGVAEELRRDPPRTGVGVLDRCVAVLGAVESGARSFTDVVEATRLTRPTVHRLIQALEDHGFLAHVGGFGYALGPRLLGLASVAMRDPLRDLARPSLEGLARTTAESAQLFVRDGDRRVCVDSAESERELRTIVEIGASLPLTKGSAGKVFLAWAGDRDRARLLETAEDPAQLDQQLFTIRRRGWADSVAEREPGVASVSAPIFGPDGSMLAVISISGPASRLGRFRATRYAGAVVEAAREVEETLGVSV